MRRARPRIPRWVARRGPLALLAAVPVLVIGGAALGSTGPTYTGTATFVVPSGATATGPGSSYEARSLALTYARLIPEDRSLLQVLARSIGESSDDLVGTVSATPVVDTALVRVSYRSGDLPGTEKVLAAAVGALTGTTSPTSAIPPGTLVLTGTSIATADAEGAGASRALVAIAALVLAAVVIVLAERTDPRIDAADELTAPDGAAVLDCSRLAGSVARRILWTRAAREGVEQIVLIGADEHHAEAVTWCDERLRPDEDTAPSDGRTGITLERAGRSRRLEGIATLPDPTDPSLGRVTDHDVALVVRAGTRRRHVADAIATLHGADARVRWLVFAPARLRRHGETGTVTTLSSPGSDHDPGPRPDEGAVARGR